MGLGSGIRDPRSGIRKKPIPDPGSRIKGSKRHRIPDPGSGSATLIVFFGSVFTLDPTGLGLRPQIMGRHEIMYGNFGRSFQAGSRLFVLNTPPFFLESGLPPAVSFSKCLDFMSMSAAFGSKLK